MERKCDYFILLCTKRIEKAEVKQIVYKQERGFALLGEETMLLVKHAKRTNCYFTSNISKGNIYTNSYTIYKQ